MVQLFVARSRVSLDVDLLSRRIALVPVLSRFDTTVGLLESVTEDPQYLFYRAIPDTLRVQPYQALYTSGL